MGRIADILQSRGDLDKALRIRRRSSFRSERLGDVRSRAVTMGKSPISFKAAAISTRPCASGGGGASGLRALGDVRSRAVTMGKIADILQDRGDLDEALRIRGRSNFRSTNGSATCARAP